MDTALPRGAALRSRVTRLRGQSAPRDRACEPGAGRPRRPLRPPGLHGLACALPDVVARPARRPSRRLGLPRRRPLPCGQGRCGSRTGPVAARLRLAQRRLVAPHGADQAGPRRGLGGDPRGAHVEGLPLDLAQLGGAGAGRWRPAGSGRRRRARRAGRADGRPERGVRLAFPQGLRPPHARRDGRGERERIRIANASGVTSVHDKDGWLGRSSVWQKLEKRARSDAARVAVAAEDPRPRPRRDGIALGLGQRSVPVGFIKAFMDGTLGSQTARLMDGSGVEITSREQFEDIVRRAARPGFPVAVHAIGDRANRDALDAFEAPRQRSGVRRASASGSSTRSSSPGRTCPRRRARAGQDRVQFTHAPSDRDLTETQLGRPGPTAPTPCARSSTPAQWSRTAPTPRSRSSTRCSGSAGGVLRTLRRTRGVAPRAGGDGRGGLRGHGVQRPGSPATSGGAGGSLAGQRRRPRGPRSRPGRGPSEELTEVRGRSHDARRPLGSRRPRLRIRRSAEYNGP